jgi:hypothetical protein
MDSASLRDLARICIEKKQTFALIDDIVMMRACGERGSTRLHTLFKCVMPFSFFQPFSTTAGLVSPEMFFGRQAERDSLIRKDGACFLYGGRQLGKTALLRDVVRRFHDPDKGHIAIWMDLKEEGLCLDRDINFIWHLIVTRLKEHEVLSAKLPSNTKWEGIGKNLEKWVGEDNQRRILLLLDEADQFLNSDAKDDLVRTARMKGWIMKTDRRVKIIFAGLHDVQRTTKQPNHPLAHFDDPICIGPLLDNGEWREARALIEDPFETMGFKFESPDLVSRILSRTNYYPNLIQLYCKHLLEYLTDPNRANFDSKAGPPYIITSELLESAYRQDQNLHKAIRNRFMLTLNLAIVSRILHD